MCFLKQTSITLLALSFAAVCSAETQLMDSKEKPTLPLLLLANPANVYGDAQTQAVERKLLSLLKLAPRPKQGETNPAKADRIFAEMHRLVGTIQSPEELERLIVEHALEQVKQKATTSIDGYVFTTKNGQPIDKHLDHVWRSAVRKAGLRHRPSYQLRHTFASLCLQSGVAPGWLANVLGHSTLQTTFKHYARFIKDTSRENETRLEHLLMPDSTGKRKAT